MELNERTPDLIDIGLKFQTVFVWGLSINFEKQNYFVLFVGFGKD